MSSYSQLDWTPERVQRFWNYHSQFPDHYFTLNKGKGILLRLQPHLAGRSTVLDYGCGGGHLLALLLHEGYRAGGLDFSNEAVKAADERFASHSNYLGAWHPDAILEEGQRFDAILVVEVIEHLYDDVLDETLERVRRLLAPGGVVIFTTPNEENLEKAEIFCPACEHVFHRWQHVRSWSAGALRTYVESRDFEVVDVFATDFGAAFLRGNPKKKKALRRRIQSWLRPTRKQPNLVLVAGIADA